MPAVGADEDQDDRRQHQAERLEQVGEGEARNRDEDQRPEVELRHFRPFLDDGIEQHDQAERRQQAAEHDGEIGRPHANRAAHLVAGNQPRAHELVDEFGRSQRNHDEEQPEGDEHQPGP
jgi:hypothetical protein